MTLSRKNSTPLYEQLKDVIEHKININEYKLNEKIPSERELGEKYGVSRITVRQAIRLAEKEGLVSKSHGIGTFVSSPTIKQELNKVSDFKSTVAQLGVIGTTKILQTNAITCDFKLAKLLNINVMDKCLNMQLIGSSKDLPIVYYNTFFPYDLGEKVKEAAEKAVSKNVPFSTLDLYKDFEELNPTHVEQTFESLVASPELEKILHLDKSFPLLKITSIIYQDKEPLEYKEAYYRGDKYRFFITREINL